MAVSSIGVGSGLDVEKIVTPLVELEKAPIKTLEVKAEQIQSKISTYGEIKSLTDDLNSAVRDLTLDRTWNTVKINSSSSSTANATMTGAATAGSYNLVVEKLAQAQTSVTGALDKDAKIGAGTMEFKLGAAPQPDDTRTPISIAITANDTVSSMVAKINADTVLSKSVVASVVTDAAGKHQIMIRARETGEAGKFEWAVTGTDGNETLMSAQSGQGQQAQNAEIKLNGVSLVSSSNTFADTIPGLSITASAVGSSLLSVTEDKDAIKASITKFVDAYNALNTLLTDSTKYTEESKTAGVLQGDGSTVSLLNSLRMLTQGVAGNASGVFNRLSDAGIQMLQGGKLSVDDTKLSTALGDMASLKSMFAAKSDNLGQGGGLATNFKTFTDALLAGEGTIYSKTESLEAQLKRNGEEQERVEDRATTVEARLRAQYTALDVKMASLNSLSSYVEQMVTTWNQSKD